MKKRTELNHPEASSLLRDITMYRALTMEQILRLHPGRKESVQRLLAYFVQQHRVWLVDGLYCAAPECAAQADKGLMDAVWVLTDFIDRVEFHSVGDYPAKIIFFADGQVYEIIHASYGKEALVNYLLAAQKEPASRCIVLVDDISQICELDGFNVSGYCTVSSEGVVQYYKKEEGV